MRIVVYCAKIDSLHCKLPMKGWWVGIHVSQINSKSTRSKIGGSQDISSPDYRASRYDCFRLASQLIVGFTIVESETNYLRIFRLFNYFM
jgi:hypothetical protein